MTLARVGELQDLKAPQKWLLVLLASYADENGECWPSQKKLAAQAGMTRQSVNKNLKVLQEKGYIHSQQRIDKEGDLATNLYTINVAKVPPERRSKVVPIRSQTTEEKLTDRSWAE